MKPTEIFEAIFALEPMERSALIHTLYEGDEYPGKLNHVEAASGKTSADAVDAALASIAGCSANLRRAIVAALVERKVIAPYSDKISAGAGATRRTINSIAASSSASIPLLTDIQRTCARMGFALKPDVPVDVVEMNKALSGGDITQRMTLKSKMAQVGLIA